MSLHFTIYNVVILLGGIQGIILSFVLFFSGKKYRIANKFLALIVFVMGFTNLDEFAGDSNFYNLYSFPFSIPYLYFGIGPAIYFYAKYLINPRYFFSRRDFLHFIPLLIQTVYYLSTDLWMDQENFQIHVWIVSPIESYAGMISIFVYSLITFKNLRKYQSLKDKSSFNTTPPKKLVFLLKSLVISFFIVVILWFAIYLYTDIVYKFSGNDENFSDVEMYFPVLFGLTIIIYTLGFSGYYKNERDDTEPKPEKKPSVHNQESDIIKEEFKAEVEKLTATMKIDKLYLDPELSLSSLANHVDINPKTLSFILNSVINKKFTDYVNEYRVEEVKKRLVDPNYNNLTIIGIAFDSGFNSKAAFNRIFKNQTNMSPKKYREHKITSSIKS